MGTNERQARGLLESDTEEDPTRILAQDDSPTVESKEDPTVTKTLDAPAPSPASLRALGIAPTVAAKPLAPLSPMAPKVAPSLPPRPAPKLVPIVEPEPEGDHTEVGVVARLVAVGANPRRSEHTLKMNAPPPVAPAMPPSPAAPPVEEDPPYEVPGLETSGRGKWSIVGAVAIVIVAVGGVVVGRMSASATHATPVVPTATTSDAPVAAPAPAPAPASSIPSAESLDERAAAAASTPAPPPPAPTHAPERHPVVRATPHPAPAPRPRPTPAPANGIVHDAPF